MEKLIEMMLQLAEEKKYRQLKEILMEMNEVDIAAFIDELDSEKTVVVFRILPKELATDVFACLSVEKQQHIITSITDREVATIIEDLFVDDAVDMLEELPATVVKKVLQNAKPDTRALINQFLKYPDNSAGSIMTAEYVGLKKTMTVKEAFDYIRRHGVDKETIYTCYVMNEARQLEGVVTVRDLLMNSYETVMEDIMDTHVIKAVTTDDQEEVADCFQKYGLLNLPVVDHENRLVGIVTVDDIVDVIEQEATEDFEKMAAMAPSEKPYLKTGVFQLAKNRIFWLMVLMISSLITGGILAKYENAFAVLPLLVTFIPMLTDTRKIAFIDFFPLFCYILFRLFFVRRFSDASRLSLIHILHHALVLFFRFQIGLEHPLEPAGADAHLLCIFRQLIGGHLPLKGV